MTAQEVKDFWRGYCVRRKVSSDLIARGDAKIDQDPDRWADETMDTLLNLVSGESRNSF